MLPRQSKNPHYNQEDA
jgi:hypothetical protein